MTTPDDLTAEELVTPLAPRHGMWLQDAGGTDLQGRPVDVTVTIDDPEDVAPVDAGDPNLHGREAAYWSEAGRRALSKRISEDHE